MSTLILKREGAQAGFHSHNARRQLLERIRQRQSLDFAAQNDLAIYANVFAP